MELILKTDPSSTEIVTLKIFLLQRFESRMEFDQKISQLMMSEDMKVINPFFDSLLSVLTFQKKLLFFERLNSYSLIGFFSSSFFFFVALYYLLLSVTLQLASWSVFNIKYSISPL